MNLKKILIIVASFILLIIAGIFFLFTNFLKAIKVECEVTIIAKTNEFEIRDKSCIGFAGPRYSTYYLYKNGANIATGNKIDTCLIRFRSDDLTLDLNKCENKLTVN